MDTKSFFELDFNGALFPLKTNLLMIQNHHQGLEAYISKILSNDPAHVGDNFLPQTRVHAAKPRHHVRRTMVLDPIASYFLYDLIFRNREAFDLPVSDRRCAFGYRFNNDQPISVHAAYKDYTNNIDAYGLTYQHSIAFDIASYFNSVYHHDATNWFSSLPKISAVDGQAFGRFFREINSGRSIDFLPQGIYPSKMIGSAFLRYIETSGQIKSAQLLRFMDDIWLFDDDVEVLKLDFIRIQELLGLRALNINPTKTLIDSTNSSVRESASAIQKQLSEIVDSPNAFPTYSGSGFDIPDEEEDSDEEGDDSLLDETQVDRLLELLVDPLAEEADVETILKILQEHFDGITTHLPLLLLRFPNIIKQLHKIAGSVTDKETLTREIIVLLESPASLMEYQLFWIAVIAEDYLGNTEDFGKLILKLYDRTAEHKIARAKILEIPDQSFGLKEIRAEILKSGASDWPSWASAMGTRTLNKAERNHALKYFSKGSPLNFLVAECVEGFA